MFEFHKDKARYFTMQYKISDEYVVPFIEPFTDLSQPIKVLEIGCAEAGVLKAFTDRGHQCTGIELHESRVKLAKEFMAEELKAGKISFLAKDIYDVNPKEEGLTFDLIILKDVIEHIHDQEKFMLRLQDFLNPGGKVFFGFPPWYMPFGGHQQICKGKILSKLPYYHLLPMFMYKGVLKLFGESEKTIADLEEIKQTGISIERFQRILKKSGYTILKKQFFLTNPIYKYKFKLKVRKQIGLISALPFLRNFWTTCVYYYVEKKKN